MSARAILLESGAIVGEDGAPASVAPRRLLLSRALCQYRFFRAPEGLSRGQMIRAARVHAQAHAPFSNSGVLLLRANQGVGIWYWDAALVEAANGVSAPVHAAPETLQRDVGDGWRILTCAEGYEAQYWEAGDLMASTWRRRAFTAPQWSAFALSVEPASMPAPDAPPEAQSTPLLSGEPWRRLEIRRPLEWRDAENAGVTAAMVCTGVAALFLGQTLHFSAMARGDAQRLAALEAQAAADPALRTVQTNQALIHEYNALAAAPDILAASADLQEALASFGVEVRDWRLEDGRLHVVLNASLSQLPLHDVVSALEVKPLLCNVAPTFSNIESGIELDASIAEDGECEGGSP